MRAVILPGFLSNQAEISKFGAQKMSNVHLVRQKTRPGLRSGLLPYATPVMKWKEGRNNQLWLRQCWTVSGVRFLPSPSHIKTIKSRNLFKAANGETTTTDFLICDDFIENVDSGLYELKLFFP